MLLSFSTPITLSYFGGSGIGRSFFTSENHRVAVSYADYKITSVTIQYCAPVPDFFTSVNSSIASEAIYCSITDTAFIGPGAGASEYICTPPSVASLSVTKQTLSIDGSSRTGFYTSPVQFTNWSGYGGGPDDVTMTATLSITTHSVPSTDYTPSYTLS